MARTPRPVNPDEGPVQAFAFDLRALREAAGNPTYRALAKVAGYSATTLGDAAGGAHLPTLEVTAAYVGACGGDVEEWRARWQRVSGELARDRAGAAETGLEAGLDSGPEAELEATPVAGLEVASEVAPAAAPAPAPAIPPAVRRGRIRPFLPWIAVAAALVGILVAGFTGAFAAQQPGRAATASVKAAASRAVSAPATGCPTPHSSSASVLFTGVTYGPGANVRGGASLESPVRYRIPAGCSIGFSGYCLGDVVQDATAGTPDMRWFIIPGGGEVASAVVHGDPPATATPQSCPDDVPGPASISLAVSPTGTGGGVVELLASGTRLWIVGFAAYYPSAGAGTPPRWHQFGLSADATSGTFSSAPLRLPAGSTGTSAGAPVPVVAVACLGGLGPTSVVATAAVRSGAPQATLLPLAPRSAPSLTAAEQAACAYPGGPGQ